MVSIEKQLVESSRTLIDMVVASIGNNQELFDETMELMYLDKYPVSMRAAWIAYLVSNKFPQLVKPHLNRLMYTLKITKVDGVKRSILKMFIETPYKLSDEVYGELADIAFTFVQDQKQAIAVRAFSIDILLKVSKIYPEITNEIAAILEGILPDCSRGLKNKCQKILLHLNNKKH
jgi:hypothetical protein